MLLFTGMVALAPPVHAQTGSTARPPSSGVAPEVVELLHRVDLAHETLLAELAQGSHVGRTGFEDDLVARLIGLVRDGPVGPEPASLDVLGGRTAAIIRHGRAFQHDVVEILADPAGGDVRGALEAALRRYRDRADIALPASPKNMDVLYDHGAALELRTRYPRLDGFLWSGQWFRLAVTEPLTDLSPGPERSAGVDTVQARFFAKLTEGDPPWSFPTELPLAPAIAPGLLWVSAESAIVWDNLSLFLEVVGDVLVSSSDIEDARPALDAAVDFFLDPEAATTGRVEWETMALRHGIFFQGGFPLAVMTRSERNMHAHGAHLRGGAPLVIPGMIGR